MLILQNPTEIRPIAALAIKGLTIQYFSLYFYRFPLNKPIDAARKLSLVANCNLHNIEDKRIYS